jgi:hypothetical protein
LSDIRGMPQFLVNLIVTLATVWWVTSQAKIWWRDLSPEAKETVYKVIGRALPGL